MTPCRCGRLAIPAAWVLVACVVAGCDCRPVLPTHWSVLTFNCNGQSDFGRNGGQQLVLDSKEELEQFVRYQCKPGEAPVYTPRVDFTRRVVIVDGTWSPLGDGTCIKQRRVSRVEACVGGVQMLFDDTKDEDCAERLLTTAISIERSDAHAAFSTPVDALASP